MLVRRNDSTVSIDSTSYANRHHVYCAFGDLVCCSIFHSNFFVIIADRKKIENPRKLAASFALAITAPTAVGQGWIAKKGNQSLFAALRLVLPQVIMKLQ